MSSIKAMCNDEAFDVFKSIRWAENNGEAVCPSCGHKESWSYKTRKIFKCKHCNKQFSFTSGTVFANRKLPIRDYLLAIAIFVNSHKGIPALQLSRDLDVQYKTAFVMAHKIRESLGSDIEDRVLQGEVEVDGAYFGGYIKPANKKEDRIDRRLAKNQNGKRRCVFIIRERNGRSVPVVIRSENTKDVKAAMLKNICRTSTVYADENPAYDALHGIYNIKRINHSVAYSDGDICTNGAEGWFSRMRRAEIGQHHHLASRYLHAYAKEMSYREDNRRMDNGSVMQDVLKRCLTRRPSANWSGYWQGNRQVGEMMVSGA